MIYDAVPCLVCGDYTATYRVSVSAPCPRLKFIAPLSQDIADIAFEEFHHAFSLRTARLDQAMLDAMGLALLIVCMVPASLTLPGPSEAIGIGFSVVCKHYLYLEGCFLLQMLHERMRILR